MVQDFLAAHCDGDEVVDLASTQFRPRGLAYCCCVVGGLGYGWDSLRRVRPQHRCRSFYAQVAASTARQQLVMGGPTKPSECPHAPGLRATAEARDRSRRTYRACCLGNHSWSAPFLFPSGTECSAPSGLGHRASSGPRASRASRRQVRENGGVPASRSS